MCWIITIAAAVVTTWLWWRSPALRAARLGVLVLTYWGAALMWSVDVVASAIAGEPPLDLGTSDALLGLLVVAAGLAMWAVVARLGRRGVEAVR
ncbi:hypothetical protein GCM10009785_19990 [Brooklawnia cerclae]|uniref:Transporter n=1 Tax=Brooklawnia cerclae TaxID=349934 RepID=A0ABX0SFX2_9ACTN|nr:hypothetical protein [Brooklawnia cerclae]NIH57259.1 putative transporter [Brooklawnia cerclae]